MRSYRYLTEKEAAQTVELKRKLMEKELQIINAADMSNFMDWSENGPVMKTIIDQKLLAGIKSVKIDKRDFETKDGNTGSESKVALNLMDSLAAMKQLRAALDTPLHSAGANSTDLEIHELWERFSDQTREDSLTALDFAHELSARNYPVPESIKMQAQHELAATQPLDPLAQEGVSPEDFSFENLDQDNNENMKKFLEHHQKEVEEFIPKREGEVKNTLKEHGFDKDQKPKDDVIEADDVFDDPTLYPDGISEKGDYPSLDPG